MRGRIVRAVLSVAAVVAGVAGCTAQEPEITAQDQVPAAARTETAAPEPGGGDGTPAEGEFLVWVADDIFYADAPESAPAGELPIEIVNEGNLVHNVVFEGVDDDRVIAEAPGGGTDQGSVTVDSGSYVYYCSIPGHREAGMEGEIAIE